MLKRKELAIGSKIRFRDTLKSPALGGGMFKSFPIVFIPGKIGSGQIPIPVESNDPLPTQKEIDDAGYVIFQSGDTATIKSKVKLWSGTSSKAIKLENKDGIEALFFWYLIYGNADKVDE